MSGNEYFYVNSLHVRDRALADTERSPANGRKGWFACACCPPNVMRTFASLEGYVASTDADGVQVHQYVPGVINTGDFRLSVQTDYPWAGRITITVDQAPTSETTVSVRIPAWATGATLDGRTVEPGTYAKINKVFQSGDQVVLELPLEARLTAADPRVDAVRGCVAIERGPLVYALEQQDQPDAVAPDHLRIDPAAGLVAEHRAELLDGIVVLRGRGAVVDHHDPAAGFADHPRPELPTTETELVAVPYHLWANRGAQPMRVWIPVS